jgi:hypothetical protein
MSLKCWIGGRPIVHESFQIAAQAPPLGDISPRGNLELIPRS